MRKKIVYVLQNVVLAGGIKVIAEHVTGLVERGHDAEVWHIKGDWSWFPRPVPHRRFPNADVLRATLQFFRGVKVATFWTTATWIAANLQPGEQGYYLIQDEDELTYSGSSAGTSYKLGLVPIAVGEFVTDLMWNKHSIRCTNAGIGIDHRIFQPLPFVREQHRILTPFRTTSAGPLNLKGWDLTMAALRLVSQVVPQTSVVTFGVQALPQIDWIPHVHIQYPTDRKLRELYSQSGVFLSASRHEGFGLPMLEAMACGCPVVCTDAGGNREFCRHNDTAMVCEARSAGELAAHLQRVLTDPVHAKQLSSAGLKEVVRYHWSKVIDNLEAVYGL